MLDEPFTERELLDKVNAVLTPGSSTQAAMSFVTGSTVPGRRRR
jgi:hypothetical protein